MAEHAWNVAQIAKEFCKRRFPTDKLLRQTCVEYAIDHDIDEIMDGDVPGHRKNGNMVYDLGGELTPHKIVKLADLIDQYVFIEEHNCDRHGRQVAIFCRKAVRDTIQTMSDANKKVAFALISELLDARFEL